MEKLTLGQLETIFDRLKEEYEKYLKISKEKLYKTISSADGKKMHIYIPKSAVPHLLGIDTNCYSAIFSSKEKSSIKIFEEMLDKGAYNLYINANKLNIDISSIISPYIFEKLENFKNVLRYDIEKIEFICHYDKEKSYNIKDQKDEFDHLILTKLDDSKYSLVTFSDNKTEDGFITIPRSNQLINDEEILIQKLSSILPKQTITIATVFTPNSDVYDGSSKSFFLRNELKIKKIESARLYCKKYNVNLDTSYDYLSVVKFSGRKTDLSKSKKTYLELVANAIKEGEIITEEYLNVNSFSELPDEIILIVNEHNNSLFKKSTNTKIGIKYSDMNKANEELRRKNSTLESDLKKLNEKLMETNCQLKKTQEENYNLNEKINEARRVLG